VREPRPHELFGRPVVHPDGAQCPATGFGGDARPGAGIGDAPRKEQVHGRLEVARVLDEEGSLLREEHLEPLVDRHLRLVRLHLAEVRVDRAVQRDGIPDHGLQVQAQAPVRGVPERRNLGVEEAGTGERAVRNRLDVPAR